jgi:Protein of unknown function (DUF3225)
MQDPEINKPAVLAEVEAVFEEYEQALVSNNVEVLDKLFRNADYTLRYGAGENLYGYAAIQAFRQGRPASNLARTLTARSITSFGDTMAVANVEFKREGSEAVGRQSQTWVRFVEGWRVVSAHVSIMK